MPNGMTFRVRSGASLARGTTIDEYLPEDDCKVLYEKWQDGWPEPLMFSGGVRAITCEMVLEVPVKELNRVLGRSKAATIYEVSKNNAAR
jgi:hypothetical protein